MSRAKPKPGDILLIRFHDHAEGYDKVADITAVGRLVDEDATQYRIDGWYPTDPDEKRKKGRNDRTTWVIVKGAVIEYTVLSKSAHKGR